MVACPLAGKFELSKHLGSGSFGEVYLAVNVTSGELVAVKLEKKDKRHQQLLLEAKLYRLLAGSQGIPKLFTYGVDGGDKSDYNVLVMELLGTSLESCFRQVGKKMSIKSAMMVTDQIIERVETLHSHNFLHRDIKPDNFLMGIGKNIGTVYMIDLGLAKKYKSSTSNQHIPFRDGKSLTGTARYASLATHLGMEQSRRDDMASVGYMLMYFLRGNLPWQGLQLDAKDCKEREDRYVKIKQTKISTTPEKLCEGFPRECVEYLNYVSTLEFNETPDYAYCRKLFQSCLSRLGYAYDFVYDWTPVDDASPRTPKKVSPKNRNIRGRGRLAKDLPVSSRHAVASTRAHLVPA